MKWSETSPSGHLVEHQEYETDNGEMVTLGVGDLIKIANSFRLVTRASHSGVRHVSIAGQTKTATFRKGFDDEKTVKMTSWGDAETCCSTLPREMLVRRLGPEAVNEFQAAKQDGTVAAWIERNTGSVTTENNEPMKTTSKLPRRGGLAADVAATKAAEAAVETKPKKAGKKAKAKKPEGDRVTGKLFDNSIGAVLRALGKAGVTEEQAAKILKEKGFTSSPITIKVNIRSGNGSGHDYGAPAKLTEAQLDELKSLI